MERAKFKKRNDAIVKYYLAGYTQQQTGERFGLSQRRVSAILDMREVRTRTGAEAVRRGPRTEKNERREERIIARLEQGYTFAKTARALRCSIGTVAGAVYRYRRRMEEARDSV